MKYRGRVIVSGYDSALLARTLAIGKGFTISYLSPLIMSNSKCPDFA